MSDPRQHHILPVFYLSGFTDTGTAKGFLHVFDYFNKKRYQAKPTQVAKQRDFYRYTHPDIDPFYMENELSKMESEYAPVLKNVLKTGRVNSNNEMGALLSFVSLLHVRSKRCRELLSYSIEQTMYRKILDGKVTREEWEDIRKLEIRSGADMNQWPPFDEVKELVRNDLWRPQTPKNLKVDLIATAHAIVVDVLVDKKWSLAEATIESGGFICSDSPLNWSSYPSEHSDLSLDNLSSTDVTVTIPLNKNYALITREDEHGGTYEAAKEVVAWVNARTHLHSLGTLYSEGEKFYLNRLNNSIGLSTDYFNFVEEGWRNGIRFP
ncbi:DUF4238 domain-containing protein [Pontibacter silvestris]|uniref:DUF4238 domain-containing protein n=1 Tax=Pontibacter silvestris TaxID=2305183 RepID=A0ABW4X4J8_9BACT|nr:DUF4238 domain-containing protein [Pontibacter silvestris]MCC9138798.1 DUF4238 domain-containing protein [Pontibacter silvestris]